MRNKWTSGWDGNWFYCRVYVEQTADTRGKGNYLLSSMMAPLNHLMEAPSTAVWRMLTLQLLSRLLLSSEVTML
jgi:hypothetical protein